MIKLNSTGSLVIEAQKLLKNWGFYSKGKIDGIFGPNMLKAVKGFQKKKGLTVDGIVGPKTFNALKEMQIYQIVQPSKFVVFLDAGHGGLDDNNEYTTRGKYHRHPGLTFHKGEYFLEGVENRIIAERVAYKLAQRGIHVIRTYHAYKDWSLSKRVNIVKSWLRRGYHGYMHSIHSNAISTSLSEEKLNSTTGFIVFNTRGETFSDQVATQHFKHMKNEIGDENWRFREQKSKDGDSDYEANFKVLRETDTEEFRHKFAAIMDEHGFFTSRKDAQLITTEEHRWKRTNAIVDTAEWTKKQFAKKLKL